MNVGRVEHCDRVRRWSDDGPLVTGSLGSVSESRPDQIAEAFLQAAPEFPTGSGLSLLEGHYRRRRASMVHDESVPITTEELENLVQAINADRRAGRRSRKEADEEIVRLTEHRWAR